jgi:hypothetical protein
MALESEAGQPVGVIGLAGLGARGDYGVGLALVKGMAAKLRLRNFC